MTNEKPNWVEFPDDLGLVTGFNQDDFDMGDERCAVIEYPSPSAWVQLLHDLLVDQAPRHLGAHADVGSIHAFKVMVASKPTMVVLDADAYLVIVEAAGSTDAFVRWREDETIYQSHLDDIRTSNLLTRLTLLLSSMS